MLNPDQHQFVLLLSYNLLWFLSTVTGLIALYLMYHHRLAITYFKALQINILIASLLADAFFCFVKPIFLLPYSCFRFFAPLPMGAFSLLLCFASGEALNAYRTCSWLFNGVSKREALDLQRGSRLYMIVKVGIITFFILYLISIFGTLIITAIRKTMYEGSELDCARFSSEVCAVQDPICVEPEEAKTDPQLLRVGSVCCFVVGTAYTWAVRDIWIDGYFRTNTFQSPTARTMLRTFANIFMLQGISSLLFEVLPVSFRLWSTYSNVVDYFGQFSGVVYWVGSLSGLFGIATSLINNIAIILISRSAWRTLKRRLLRTEPSLHSSSWSVRQSTIAANRQAHIDQAIPLN